MGLCFLLFMRRIFRIRTLTLTNLDLVMSSVVLTISAFELFYPYPKLYHFVPLGDLSWAILFLVSAIIFTFSSAKIGLRVAMRLLGKRLSMNPRSMLSGAEGITNPEVPQAEAARAAEPPRKAPD